MGNHCVYITCINCGTLFCYRGCSDVGSPHAATAEQKKAEVMQNPGARPSGCNCPNCNSSETYY